MDKELRKKRIIEMLGKIENEKALEVIYYIVHKYFIKRIP